MGIALRAQFTRWINRRHLHETPPVRLTQRRIYVLPTKAGVLFGSTLVVMLMGAINYNLSLGYILVFLLSGLGIASLLHTYRVLANLTLRPGKAEPVFAGQTGHVVVIIQNPSDITRHSLQCSLQASHTTTLDVDAWEEARALLPVATERRGLLRFPRCKLSSTFPLGVFRAWSYAHLGNELLVYPKPEERGPAPPEHPQDSQSAAAVLDGQDDFAGLRRYQQGDSLKQIAWKALAHGHPLMSKQFTGGARAQLHLRWEDTAGCGGTEARLSRLCRWILEARAREMNFSVNLPSVSIPLGGGDAQVARCLSALALYDDRAQHA